MALEHPQTDYTGFYDDDKVKVNDVLKLGNILWLATSNGVTKINQTNRERVEYTEEHLPARNVESIAANSYNVIWIGTYGRGMAVQDNDDKWIPVKYNVESFRKHNAVEKDGKILLEGDEEKWLRTNFIHIDANDTLWIGTSAGVLQLQYTPGKEPVWKGPFNPKDGVLNVLFIQDIPRGIEIIGNFGEQGYPYNEEESDQGGYYGTGEGAEMKTYRLYNTIPAENGSWKTLEEGGTP